MQLTLLDNQLRFPDPRKADAEGLVAVGGELSLARLLLAYSSGIFPWTTGPVTWWSPDPRGIFELDAFHVSRSLARQLRSDRFEVTVNKCFKEVMQACAEPGPTRKGTWISAEFIAAYTRMHEEGHAHSVEVWSQGKLAGGVYGVAIGGFFAGESMFHRVSDGSKIALFHLVQRLRERQFELLDIQMLTPITEQLGGVSIPREQYLARLAKATEKTCRFIP